MFRFRQLSPVFVMAALLPSVHAHAVSAGGPKLISVQKIWDKGNHNAFTDLARWHDKWYCTFREADGHVGGDGKIRVLESADVKAWQPVALIAEEGVDLRDPKLSITPDGRLMIVAGGSVYQGTTLKSMQPRVMFSRDGRSWSHPQKVLSEGEWLWRVTWHDGKAYGVAYNPGPAGAGPAPEWKVALFVSTDGVKYERITSLDVPGQPNETTVRFLPDGEMMAMVRREAGNRLGWIGTSKPPYRAWTWKETKHRFGGPNFIVLPDGSLWGASRVYPAAQQR